MRTDLRIIPAGAGSGKTYSITHQLIDWITAGEVRPERVVAVTFTEAAAAELRGRIMQALLDGDRIDDALAIERAHVTTIHAFGLAIQTEHALAAGTSPAPRMLSEAEQELLIRLELAECTALEPIKADLARYGYRDSHGASVESAEENLRASVLAMVSLLRGLGESALQPLLAEDACAGMRALYGNVSPSPETLEARLAKAARAFLAAYPEGGTPLLGEIENKKARNDFRTQVQLIRRATRPGTLARDWKLWQGLRDLRVKAKGVQFPQDFVALSEEIMAAADAVTRHPGPLDDACRHLDALVRGAQEVLDRFGARKRAAGLIDFADMVAGAQALLQQHPDILDAVLGEVDCVIIDEFQDTNPVQFALLWRLAARAPRAILVGDTKQSIMGFQGADPALSAALERQFPDRVTPLDRNWRSDPRIMGLVNALSAQMFGEGYTALTPQRAQTGETALEVLRISQGRWSRKSRPQQHVAARLLNLLGEGARVIDRTSGAMRPLSPGDIAVLCRTNTSAARYAEALRQAGIPVRIAEDGWLDSRLMQAALAALALVANPDDSHAAMVLVTLGPAQLDLEEAARMLAEGRLLDHAALAPLRAQAEQAPWQGLDTLVPEILHLAGLFDWANGLPDALGARADLMRLGHEASAFLAAHRDMRAAAGFYGQSLSVFLGWLETRRDERGFNTRPPVGAAGPEGVEVITWHASKGREWNVVVVAELDSQVRERPGTTRAQFSDYNDLDNILAHARLNHIPRIDIPEKRDLYLDDAQPEAEQAARHLIYVALTRARDRLIVEWPDFVFTKKDGGGKVTHAGMMAEAGFAPGAGVIAIGEQEFPARISQCGDDRPPELDEGRALADPPRARYLGRPAQPDARERRPWRVTPSTLASATVPETLPPLRHIDMGAPLPPGAFADSTLAPEERGSRLHLAMRVLLERPDQAYRLGAACGLVPEALDALTRQARAIRDHLAALGHDQLHCELPVQHTAPDGSQTSAVIDCLARGTGGLAILDHKSGPAPDPEARFASYYPQLAAYAEVARTVFPQAPMRHLIVNWIDAGRLSVLTLEGAA